MRFKYMTHKFYEYVKHGDMGLWKRKRTLTGVCYSFRWVYSSYVRSVWKKEKETAREELNWCLNMKTGGIKLNETESIK